MHAGSPPGVPHGDNAMNLARYLEQHALATPERPVIRFEGRTLTYGELDAQASRLAAALRAAGVAKGDRVAIYLPNVPEFAVAYFAAQKLGAIAVSINAIFKTEEVRYLLDDSGAKVVFTVAELAQFVPPDCPALAHRIVVDAESEQGLAGWTARGDAVIGRAVAGQGGAAPAAPGAAGASLFPGVDCAPDDPAALLYSSGTTGFPKGVTLTQANIHTNIATAAKYAGYTADDRLAVFLPLFHVYGQNFILNGCVLAGASIVLFRRFVPDVVLRAIGEERVTVFFGVPTIFIGLLATDLSPYDLSSLRFEMSAAATMPEEISRRWTERFGRRIYEGYGLTECSPFACYNDLVEHRFGSVGRAVEGFELAIFDENDREAPRGTWGEIVIRGPGVMQGYWRKPEDSARALRGGWLHSGDIGRMDDDGYVYIVDRVKDMINVAGLKVWPAEVEQYLYRIPQVQEVAVYGVPHPEKGEQVVAAVVPKAGAELTADDVIAYCRASIAAYKVPARVDIVRELPKSATGKILKRVLREQAGG
jgi:long-chain acyl-CoA synthetase